MITKITAKLKTWTDISEVTFQNIIVAMICVVCSFLAAHTYFTFQLIVFQSRGQQQQKKQNRKAILSMWIFFVFAFIFQGSAFMSELVKVDF